MDIYATNLVDTEEQLRRFWYICVVEILLDKSIVI